MELIEFANREEETLRGIVNVGSSEKAIMCIHGFERTAIEDKFKNLLSTITEYTALRFDFAGCGLSDGNFTNTTVEKMTHELESATAALDARLGAAPRIDMVAHSLGGCVALRYAQIHPNRVGKIVLLAPALHQRALHRYWFAQNVALRQGVTAPVTWEDYMEYVNEDEFESYCSIETRPSKTHIIGRDYYQENKDKDYQDLLTVLPSENVLVVHSRDDDKVPLDSNDRIPEGINVIVLEGADHDMQRVADVALYRDKVITFLRG